MSYEIPVGDEQLAGVPEIGDSVIVNAAEAEDAWTHSFIGTIVKMDSYDDDEIFYVVEDPDGNRWAMTADKFEINQD